MYKPRIVVIDPAGTGRAAVSGVLHHRRWTGESATWTEAATLPVDTAVVLAVEDHQGRGRQALRSAREAVPGASRILVCSARVASMAVARGEPAHQVVVQPANAEKVLASVKRALRVRSLLRDPAVVEVAASFESLPAMPKTWRALCRLLESESSTLQDAAALVERDVGLSAKVMQLVNSGLFGLPRPVGSLFDALQRMGLCVVRDLVLSTELHGLFYVLTKEFNSKFNFSLDKLRS